jgi:hypothetical protein
VHTIATPGVALVSTLPEPFDGKPTRTAGAQRRRAEAARQPLSGSRLPVGQPCSAWRRHDVDQGAELHRTRGRISARSLTPSCADCVAVNTSGVAEAMEDLQYTLGEGHALDAPAHPRPRPADAGAPAQTAIRSHPKGQLCANPSRGRDRCQSYRHRIDRSIPNIRSRS